MSTRVFRNYFCGFGGIGTWKDYKDAIIDSASVWRDFTFGTFPMEMSPPVPKWISIPNGKIGRDEFTPSRSPTDCNEERRICFLPQFVLNQHFWQDDSSTKDDEHKMEDDDSDDGSSYAPSPTRTWQSTTSKDESSI
jgi:hypothetical protein